MVNGCAQVDFVVRELSHDAHHHVVLWLGVMYDKLEGLSLDRSTMDEALIGYDIVRAARSMGERFAKGVWSMNALGSKGAVWSDTSVTRMLGKFGAGDTVSLLLDPQKRELRVRVTNANGAQSEEWVAVRRLVRTGVPLPKLHAIAPLTDVAVPSVGRPARAVVELRAPS